VESAPTPCEPMSPDRSGGVADRFARRSSRRRRSTAFAREHPGGGRRPRHLRGDQRALITTISRATGSDRVQVEAQLESKDYTSSSWTTYPWPGTEDVLRWLPNIRLSRRHLGDRLPVDRQRP